jgi:2-haloacid dehalogenase
VWHRLDPWPDSVPGLTRLKRKFVLATLSNGNVALIVNMAKYGGLPWDAVLGAEVARHYKPEPEAYLTTAALLGLAPDECMMVAAHNGDLAAASAVGLRTAFVPRPAEHGPGQARDVKPAREWDVVASDFVDLAARLGC